MYFKVHNNGACGIKTQFIHTVAYVLRSRFRCHPLLEDLVITPAGSNWHLFPLTGSISHIKISKNTKFKIETVFQFNMLYCQMFK